MRRLAELTWTEVGTGSVLVIPVGSCEQHGPHLPLDTDLRVAQHLAGAVAAIDERVVVGPPVAIGASGEHESFPGTLSIGTEALVGVVVELARSALPAAGSGRPDPFDALVLVNGHGGNVEALSRAAAVLAAEGRDVTVWHPQVPDGDSHAGRTETSLLLHLEPDCVRTDRLEVGSTARWRDIGPTVVADGLAAVTANGVLGDPTLASADHGRELFDALVTELSDVVAAVLAGR